MVAPYTIGRRMRQLVPNELEARLVRAQGVLDPNGGWTVEAQARGVLIDLSLVEWVDLGSLMHVALLVESAMRWGVQIRVAMPLARMQQTEEELVRDRGPLEDIEDARRSVERRSAALGFMEYMQFTAVLRATHLSEVASNLRILRNYDPGLAIRRGEVSNGVEEDDVELAGIKFESQAEPWYQFCFPLQWFSGTPTEDLEKMARFLANVVGQPERGLESIDAKSIANVILYELVENVQIHAGKGRLALVTAWARPQEFAPNAKDYLKVERSYIDWVGQTKVPVVDVLIGDSGKGIARALSQGFQEARKRKARLPNEATSEEANILLWAFDRWSSSRDSSNLRGTRGLYRVDRVVKKYQGIITARSGEHLAGWDHGGLAYDVAIVHPGKLSPLPGTLVRLRLPAFREAQPSWRGRSILPEDVRFLHLKLDSLGRNGIGDDHMQRVRRALEVGQADRPSCVVLSLDAPLGHPKGVEEVIRQAVEIRHPATLVLSGMPGGWETVEVAVNSVNAEHANRSRNKESYDREHFVIWDPVLVVGEGGQYAWAGVSGSLELVLSSLINSPSGYLSLEELRLNLSVLGLKESEQAAMWRDLRNDSSLVEFRSDNQVGIRITVQGLLRRIGQFLSEHISQGKAGVLSGGLFRTPSLLVVDKWLNVDVILESSCGVDLAMLALSNSAKQQSWWARLGDNSFLVADESVGMQRLKQLSAHLGSQRFRVEVMPAETGAPIAHGVSLVTRGASVLIYCDIILSAETVRRCLSLVMRDEARPQAILCAFDARPSASDDMVGVWGVEVPVVSLVKLQMLSAESPGIPINAMNPVTREREREGLRPKLLHRIDHDSLKEVLLKTDALHFNHVGRPIGRHFTFYLDASKLLEAPIFSEAFRGVVDEWIAELQPDVPLVKELELWHSTPEPKPPAPARSFAEWIQTQPIQGKIKYRRTVRRESAYGRWTFVGAPDVQVSSSSVLIVDWGALTGTSIMQMIRLAAESGAESILACIFVSQLSAEDESFFQSLDKIKVQAKRRSEAGQMGLPGLTLNEDSRPRPVKVRVRFLCSLPFGVYDRLECPVCQQLARLSHEIYPSMLLSSFSRLQKEQRLRARTREEILNAGPRDFDGKELASSSVIWMVEFRQRLAEALVSTNGRLGVLRELRQMQEEAASIGEDGGRVCDFIHFLAVESQWLRRAPLNFHALREHVANIALLVARSGNIGEATRRNAIVVVRSASKYMFAREFASLFEDLVSFRMLAQQLLYDVFTYLSRPYHQTMRVLMPLRDGLQKLKDRIDIKAITVAGDISETIENLLVRVDAEYARAQVQSMPTSEAWSKLRREFGPLYRVEHNTVVKNADLLLPGPDAEVIESRLKEFEISRSGKLQLVVGDEDPTPYLRSLESHWASTRRFLEVTVLPLLRSLKPILATEDGRQWLGPSTTSRLLEMLEMMDSRKYLLESEFSRLVTEVAKDPDSFLTSRRWDRIKSECTWLWEGIFRPGTNEEPRSNLIEFLRSAPVRLGDAIRLGFEGVRSDTPRVRVINADEVVGSRVMVFCSADLVRDAVEEILLNCQKHQDDSAHSIEVRVGIEEDGEIVRVAFRNNRTIESSSPGIGLSQLERRLGAFGATFRANPRVGDSWSTFEVIIDFVRGDETLEEI